MKRKIDINEISDGHLYGLNDMVKADSGDCKDCSACCRGMGSSIVLDPYDLYRITTGLKTDFNHLMSGYIELNVVDGLILPNLKMQAGSEQCAFLNSEGRCRIHAVRPGICRLFPLGRLYREEGKGFDYFLQIYECKNDHRTKVKVKKWIDTPDLKRYEQFILDWHYFLEELSEQVMNMTEEAEQKKVIMYILTSFYVQPYSAGDFYDQFYGRLETAKQLFGTGID